MLRSDGDHSIVGLRDGSTVFDLRPLKWWGSVLPPLQFLRIHRSAIVQVRCIGEVRRCSSGKWHVKISGVDEAVSVSRSCVPVLRSRLGY